MFNVEALEELFLSYHAGDMTKAELMFKLMGEHGLVLVESEYNLVVGCYKVVFAPVTNSGIEIKMSLMLGHFWQPLEDGTGGGEVKSW